MRVETKLYNGEVVTLLAHFQLFLSRSCDTWGVDLEKDESARFAKLAFETSLRHTKLRLYVKEVTKNEGFMRALRDCMVKFIQRVGWEKVNELCKLLIEAVLKESCVAGTGGGVDNNIPDIARELPPYTDGDHTPEEAKYLGYDYAWVTERVMGTPMLKALLLYYSL
jgi:hypothetical protein